MHIGRGHTAGDVVAFVPDADVVFSGDLVEYRSACYCGDAHFTDWPATLDRLAEFQAKALVPGRGAALTTPAQVTEGIEMTTDFLTTLYGSVQKSVAQGRSLKDTFAAAREVMDPKFSSFAIYEHCLPFNVSRAYDEARGTDWPVIWTAERDRADVGRAAGLMPRGRSPVRWRRRPWRAIAPCVSVACPAASNPTSGAGRGNMPWPTVRRYYVPALGGLYASLDRFMLPLLRITLGAHPDSARLPEAVRLVRRPGLRADVGDLRQHRLSSRACSGWPWSDSPSWSAA